MNPNSDIVAGFCPRIDQRLERLLLAIGPKGKSTSTIADDSILTECHNIETPGAVKRKEARDGQVRDATIGVGKDGGEIVAKALKVAVVEEGDNGAKDFMSAHHRIAPHQDATVAITTFCSRQIIGHGFKPLLVLPHLEVGLGECLRRETPQRQTRDEIGIVSDQLLFEE